MSTIVISLTRRLRLISMPSLLLATLVFGLLWLGQSGPKPVSADHLPQASKKITYVAEFTTTQRDMLLSEALHHAVRWELIYRNPAEVVRTARTPKYEPTVLSLSQLHKFHEAATESPFAALFLLAIYTGLRRSELLGLEWRDVDWEHNAISVRRGAHWVQGQGLMTYSPKGDRARRVTVPDDALDGLHQHQERQNEVRSLIGAHELGSRDLVFARHNGLPFQPDNVSKAFMRIVRRLGLHGVRLHDLRHSHATLLLEQGVNTKIVQERLGHSSIATTGDIYSHVTPGIQAQVAEDFAQMYRESENGKRTSSHADQGPL